MYTHPFGAVFVRDFLAPGPTNVPPLPAAGSSEASLCLSESGNENCCTNSVLLPVRTTAQKAMWYVFPDFRGVPDPPDLPPLLAAGATTLYKKIIKLKPFWQ